MSAAISGNQCETVPDVAALIRAAIVAEVMNQISPARLSEFLADAKRKTYAGLDDDATVLTPLLPGSKPAT